ncbi:MAG: PPC domain-containing protein [bacterium]
MRSLALALLVALPGCTEDADSSPNPADATPADAVVEADARVADATPPAPDAAPTVDAAEPDAAPITPCAQEDDLAPNQRPRQAAPIEPGFSRADLYICPDQADFFAVALAAEQRIRVELAADPVDRDLDLVVLDASGEELAGSYGEYGEEALRFVAPAAGTYIIQVQSYRGQTARYRLTVAQGCRLDAACGDEQVCDTLEETCAPYSAGACGDDAHEPDDRHAQAGLLGAAAVEGLICPQDRDWFAVDIADGDTVEVEVGFTAGRNVDLVALGPEGAPGGCGAGGRQPRAGGLLPCPRRPLPGGPADARRRGGGHGVCAVDGGVVRGLPHRSRLPEPGAAVLHRRRLSASARRRAGEARGRCGRGADCSPASSFCLQGDPGGHDNVCTRECTSADDCADFGGDGICDRIQGAMVCVHACVSDDDCGLVRRCEDGECNRRGRCNGDADCGPGEACTATDFGNWCALVENP